MKRNVLVLTGLLLFMMSTNSVFSHQKVTNELSSVIKMYKAGNYTECYKKLNTMSKKDPNNALLFYYYGMSSAQLGKKDEAVEYYNKAITFAEPKSNLYRYAQKGRDCAEGLPSCMEAEKSNLTPDDLFIQSNFDTFSEKARGEYEKLKLDNLKREMNRTRDVDGRQFNNFKDFSGMEQSAPVTDQELIAAYKTLQRAGMLNSYSQTLSDLSFLTEDNKSDMNNGLFGQSPIDIESVQMLLMNNF